MDKARAKAADIVLRASAPQCGSCRYWHEYDEAGSDKGEGACFFNPPLVKLTKDGGEIVHRPTLLRDEPACGRFFPLN